MWGQNVGRTRRADTYLNSILGYRLTATRLRVHLHVCLCDKGIIFKNTVHSPISTLAMRTKMGLCLCNLSPFVHEMSCVYSTKRLSSIGISILCRLSLLLRLDSLSVLLHWKFETRLTSDQPRTGGIQKPIHIFAEMPHFHTFRQIASRYPL